MTATTVRVKRIYEQPSDDDGARVLVDRVWPRGVSKEKADLTLWLKQLAPTTQLRQWYEHDPDKWDQFRKQYTQQLHHGEQAQAFAELANVHRLGRLTVLTASKAVQISQAQVLADLLNGQPTTSSTPGEADAT